MNNCDELAYIVAMNLTKEIMRLTRGHSKNRFQRLSILSPKGLVFLCIWTQSSLRSIVAVCCHLSTRLYLFCTLASSSVVVAFLCYLRWLFMSMWIVLTAHRKSFTFASIFNARTYLPFCRLFSAADVLFIFTIEDLSGPKTEKFTDNSLHIWRQKVEFVLAFSELNDVDTNSKSPND